MNQIHKSVRYGPIKNPLLNTIFLDFILTQIISTIYPKLEYNRNKKTRTNTYIHKPPK